MKKVIYILIFTLGFISCSKHHSNNKILIVGNNPDLVNKKITIENPILNKEVIADSDGKFIIEMDASFPQYFRLNAGVSKMIYLLPGDTLIIEKNSVSSTKSNDLNSYLEKWNNQLNGLIDTIDQNYYNKKPVDFYQTLVSYYKVLTEPLNNLEKSNADITPEFLRLEKNRIMYLCYNDLIDYEKGKTIETGNVQKFDNGYYAYKSDIDFNDSTLLQYNEYTNFISNYVILESIKRKKTIKIEKIKHGDETEIILDIISNNITDRTVRNKILFDMMKIQCDRLQVGSIQFAHFKSLCSNNEFISTIDNLYQKYSVLLPGREAPDFSFLDIEGKKHSLSDFKGKYLLIDIWGIKCGPCLREMPKLKELKQKYKDEDISFICINFDEPREMWLKMLAKLDLHGIQLMVDKSTGKKFKKDYLINVFPTYILIDKEGKFINARAPYPTDGLEQLLDNLFNKSQKMASL